MYSTNASGCVCECVTGIAILSCVQTAGKRNGKRQNNRRDIFKLPVLPNASPWQAETKSMWRQEH